MNLREAVTTGDGGRIDKAETIRRAGNAMDRGIPCISRCLEGSNEWAIIGGGPSLNDHWDIIRTLKRAKVNIVSVNKSHDALLEHGIVPWAHIMLDPQERVSEYVKRPRKDVRYFIASQCHDSVFDAFTGYPIFLWHAGQDFPEGQEPTTYLKTNWPNTEWRLYPGATTVGLRAIPIGNSMGVERFHLFGFDSSRDGSGKLHAYDKAEASGTKSGRFTVRSRYWTASFDTNNHMLRQYYDFDQMIDEIPGKIERGALNANHNLVVYGSGMLPFYAATLGLHADPACNNNPMKVGGYWRDPDLPDMSAMEMMITELTPEILNVPIKLGLEHYSSLN